MNVTTLFPAPDDVVREFAQPADDTHEGFLIQLHLHCFEHGKDPVEGACNRAELRAGYRWAAGQFQMLASGLHPRQDELGLNLSALMTVETYKRVVAFVERMRQQAIEQARHSTTEDARTLEGRAGALGELRENLLD